MNVFGMCPAPTEGVARHRPPFRSKGGSDKGGATPVSNPERLGQPLIDGPGRSSFPYLTWMGAVTGFSTLASSLMVMFRF